jgi:hypothetical protein
LYRRVVPEPWPRTVRRRPPQCPSGWEIGPPDFVGVGAQRAGTTRWHVLIADHPGVARAPGTSKELHFFAPFAFDTATDARLAEYHRFFPRPPGALTGEWTPRYMYDAWTPALLHRAAPNARLLAMLRDPVERFRSGLNFSRRSRNAPDHPMVATDAVNRGLYARQLERLLRAFPADHLLVLQHERCVAAPREELRATYEFLGLDPSHVPTDLEAARHAGRGEAAPLDEGLRRELVATYEPDVAAVADRFSLDLTLWPNFTHLA